VNAREKFGFLDYFDDLKDPRVNRTKIYPLNEILLSFAQLFVVQIVGETLLILVKQN
jgi:hypothetical protein